MRKLILALAVVVCGGMVGCGYPDGYMSAVDRYNQREAAEKAAAFDKFIGDYRVVACENPDLNINIQVDYGQNKLVDEIKEENSLFNYEFFNVFAKIEELKDAVGSSYIYAHIYDISINSVSYGGWEIIVQDNIGNIISRRNGPVGVAHSDGYNGWENILVCDIPNGIPEKTFKVYIINTISNERWGFEITKKTMP